MTRIAKILADSRTVFGSRRVAFELAGTALCLAAGAVVVLGLAVVL